MLLEIIRKNSKLLLDEFDRALFIIWNRFPPGNPPDFSFVEVDSHLDKNTSGPVSKFSIHDFMKDGFLWGAPKHRRSLEKRLMRRYGSIDRFYKLLVPQKDLIVCVHCGHDHKRGYLCKNCYTNVMDETKRIQDRIIEELKLDPIDQDVVVLYKGEKEQESPEFWKGKRIVEMVEERPPWFSRNLMQKATTKTSDTKEVKPEQLG